MQTVDIGKMLKAARDDRRAAISECVVWLAKHGEAFKPEYRAAAMTRALLGDDR